MGNRIAYAQVVVCTVAWGTIGSIVGNITLDGPKIAFFRMLFGLVAVVAWMAARGQLADLKLRAHAPLLLVSGLVLAVHWGLLFEGYKRIGVDSTIFIVFLGPVLWAVAAPFVLRERLRAISIVALAISVGGIVLISVPKLGSIDRVGLAAAIGSAVLFAVLVLTGKILTEVYEPAAIVVWQQGIGTIVAAPVLAGASGGQIWRALPLLILLGAVHSGLLGIVLFHAIRTLEAQQIGVLWYLEPASAVLFAWWILGEKPPSLTLVGGALIVVAGIAIIVGDRRYETSGALSEPIVVQEVHR